MRTRARGEEVVEGEKRAGKKSKKATKKKSKKQLKQSKHIIYVHLAREAAPSTAAVLPRCVPTLVYDIWVTKGYLVFNLCPSPPAIPSTHFLLSVIVAFRLR